MADKTKDELMAEIAHAKPLVRTQWNNLLLPRHQEYNFEPSQTIPDQSMSVREIMDRYRKGLPLTGERVPVYHGEEDLPELQTMDLADRQQILEANREDIARIQRDLQKAKREQEARDRKELMEFQNLKKKSDDEKPIDQDKKK